VILILMHINNFRQFYGSQELGFAQGVEGRNVTLIHGFNGAGKTTLLNAFVWCLYGKTTPDFGSPELIASERAFAETPVGSKVEVMVRLHYKLRGEEYLVERTQEFLKASEHEQRPQELKLKIRKVERGEMVTMSGDPVQHQQRINQMLPEGLYPFFLFNGERVEWLAKKEASQEVERGIKVFLDVEIYERSLRHLRGDVARDLSAELRDIGGDELRQALEEEAKLGQSLEEAGEKDAQMKSNLSKALDNIATLETRQGEIQSLYELAKDRDRYRSDLEKTRLHIVDLDGQLCRQLSEDSYLVFCESVLAKTADLIAAARERGELPAKVKPQFVTDLLELGTCICGRSLDPHTNAEHVEHLHDWRKKVGLAEFEEAISQTSQGISELRRRRDRCLEELDHIQTSRSVEFQRRAEAADRLSVVEAQMGDKGQHGEDAIALKAQINALRSEEVRLRADMQHGNDNRQVLQDQLHVVAQRIKSLRVLDARAALVKTQKEAVEKVADILEEIFEIQKHDVRDYLSGMVGKIWNDAAIKPYSAGVLEDFSLSLTKNVNGTAQPVHGASTGEKQVLALSFVGSLVRRAKENLESQAAASRMGLVVGGEYPLVMDSPFGSLEDDYRAKVAQWIPTLAHQVVLLVSKTQWRDEVERETRPRVGREYILELHTQKQGAGRAITIGDMTFPYVVETIDPIEQTIIREVH
jgi:DNA sulfur modification protein DndD